MFKQFSVQPINVSQERKLVVKEKLPGAFSKGYRASHIVSQAPEPIEQLINRNIQWFRQK